MHLIINREPGVGGNVIGHEPIFGGHSNLTTNHEEPFLHRIGLVSAPPRKETRGPGLILRDMSGQVNAAGGQKSVYLTELAINLADHDKEKADIILM